MDLNYEGLSLENVPYYEKDTLWVSPMNYLPEVMGQMRIRDRILIHDVTLRDGEQTPGVVFKKDERIRIAQALNDIGVDRIEFGMPIVSQEIYESFEEVLRMDFKSEIVAFLRAHKDDVALAVKLGVKSAIIEHIVNPYLLKHIYELDHKATVDRIVDAFKRIEEHGVKTSLMGWDASRAGLDYLKRLYSDILDQVTPESIIFVDTYGVMTPWAMAHTFKTFGVWFPEMKFEVHNHNGFGLGAANAMAAAANGASCVHTALLGLGERDGNIALDEVAMGLKVLLKAQTNIDTTQLTHIRRLAEKISGFKNQGTKPITGDFYFMLETGVGVHAIEAMRRSGFGGNAIMAAFAPKLIGKKGYEFILGNQSGVSSVKLFLDRLGLKATKEQMKEILEAIKQESNIVKGNISELEFEHIARRVLKKG